MKRTQEIIIDNNNNQTPDYSVVSVTCLLFNCLWIEKFCNFPHKKEIVWNGRAIERKMYAVFITYRRYNALLDRYSYHFTFNKPAEQTQ